MAFSNWFFRCDKLIKTAPNIPQTGSILPSSAFYTAKIGKLIWLGTFSCVPSCQNSEANFFLFRWICWVDEALEVSREQEEESQPTRKHCTKRVENIEFHRATTTTTAKSWIIHISLDGNNNNNTNTNQRGECDFVVGFLSFVFAHCFPVWGETGAAAGKNERRIERQNVCVREIEWEREHFYRLSVSY